MIGENQKEHLKPTEEHSGGVMTMNCGPESISLIAEDDQKLGNVTRQRPAEAHTMRRFHV